VIYQQRTREAAGCPGVVPQGTPLFVKAIDTLACCGRLVRGQVLPQELDDPLDFRDSGADDLVAAPIASLEAGKRTAWRLHGLGARDELLGDGGPGFRDLRYVQGRPPSAQQFGGA
jgi:hypothetical protein